LLGGKHPSLPFNILQTYLSLKVNVHYQNSNHKIKFSKVITNKVYLKLRYNSGMFDCLFMKNIYKYDVFKLILTLVISNVAHHYTWRWRKFQLTLNNNTTASHLSTIYSPCTIIRAISYVFHVWIKQEK
jgi:hypothetical protein